MSSFKDQISNRADLREKDIELASTAGHGQESLKAKIRRVTVGERKRLVGEYKTNTDTPDHVGFGIALVAVSLVPALTIEEVQELPAAVVDELTDMILTFNGWTKGEQAKQADQFRA